MTYVEGGGNSANTPRNINSGKPFHRAYEAYRERGWLGTLPLPARKKSPPPTGWTGRNADYPDEDKIAEWLAKPKYKNANIALHLGETEPQCSCSNKGGEHDSDCISDLSEDGIFEIIGIDVDHYGEKFGGSQLKELEAQYGPLPTTWISSARDLPSGIRFFRVPRGYAFIGKAGSAIEIIQRVHRFAVVWPSWNPDAEGQYNWMRPVERNGKITYQRISSLDDLPYVDELPIISPDIPETAGWFEFLTRGGMHDDGGDIDMDLSVDEIFRWAQKEFRQDEDLCSGMREAVDHWKNLIEDEESSHDKITGAHWNLIALASEGHAGWIAAIAEVEECYVRNTIQRGKRNPQDLNGEAARSKINALRKIKAQINSGKRVLAKACLCYTPTEEDLAIVAAALAAKKTRKGKKDADRDSDQPGAAEPVGGVGDGVSDNAQTSRFGPDSTGRYPTGQPAGTPKDPGEYELTDDGNGDHWVDLYRTHAYYIPEYNEWIMWNGVEWVQGDGIAERSYRVVQWRQKSYATQLSKQAKALAASGDDHNAKITNAKAKRWAAWAERSGNRGPKDNALAAASTHAAMRKRASELDGDPMSLGVANGVIRFHDDGTVTLNDLSKEDFITLNTGVPYLAWSGETAPSSVETLGTVYAEAAEIWEDALDVWLPDDEDKRWVQKLMGYSLIGDNRERVCIFLHGTTGTGKSTFLNAIMGALGDYAGPVDLSIFRGDRHTNPALVSALPQRIITASEASQRNVLHADVFKRITGGDPIAAELKYANEIVKRVPAFTPIVATNSAPTMHGADAAVKRRLMVIPFSQQVKEDVNLSRRLTSRQVCAAVLSWCIEGWRMYCEEGIRVSCAPESVQAASDEFMTDLSDFGEFIRDRIVKIDAIDANGKRGCVSVDDVYTDYLRWSADNRTPDRDILKRNAFGRQMADNGFPSRVAKVKGKSVRVFEGIRLRYSANAKIGE